MDDTFILDTHCLIWFQENNPLVPARVMKKIQNPSNTIFFCQLSLYEIAIKQSIGKLPQFKANVNDVYNQALNDGFTFMPIKNQHLFNYLSVPLIANHRDPFDRLLLATSHDENSTILTADKNFGYYAGFVKIFW